MAAVTVVFWTVADLKTPSAAKGILSLEVAGNVHRAQAILHSWHVAGWDRRAGFNLGIDLLYIPAYAGALALAYSWLAGALARHRETGGPWGWEIAAALVGGLAWLQVAAGLLDLAEDAFLFRQMNGPLTRLDVRASALCAWGKFGILIAGGLAAVLALGSLALRRAIGDRHR